MKKKATKKHLSRKFEVLVPCIYSEIYWVHAKDETHALALVKGGFGECIGESCTGTEDAGYRVKEIQLIRGRRK